MAGANRGKWVHQAHFKVTSLKGLFLGNHTFLALAQGFAPYACLSLQCRGLRTAASTGVIWCNLLRAVAFGCAILDVFDARTPRTAVKQLLTILSSRITFLWFSHFWDRRADFFQGRREPGEAREGALGDGSRHLSMMSQTQRALESLPTATTSLRRMASSRSS